MSDTMLDVIRTRAFGTVSEYRAIVAYLDRETVRIDTMGGKVNLGIATPRGY